MLRLAAASAGGSARSSLAIRWRWRRWRRRRRRRRRRGGAGGAGGAGAAVLRRPRRGGRRAAGGAHAANAAQLSSSPARQTRRRRCRGRRRGPRATRRRRRTCTRRCSRRRRRGPPARRARRRRRRREARPRLSPAAGPGARSPRSAIPGIPIPHSVAGLENTVTGPSAGAPSAEQMAALADVMLFFPNGNGAANVPSAAAFARSAPSSAERIDDQTNGHDEPHEPTSAAIQAPVPTVREAKDGKEGARAPDSRSPSSSGGGGSGDDDGAPGATAAAAAAATAAARARARARGARDSPRRPRRATAAAPTAVAEESPAGSSRRRSASLAAAAAAVTFLFSVWPAEKDLFFGTRRRVRNRLRLGPRSRAVRFTSHRARSDRGAEVQRPLFRVSVYTTHTRGPASARAVKINARR